MNGIDGFLAESLDFLEGPWRDVLCWVASSIFEFVFRINFHFFKIQYEGSRGGRAILNQTGNPEPHENGGY